MFLRPLTVLLAKDVPVCFNFFIPRALPQQMGQCDLFSVSALHKPLILSGQCSGDVFEISTTHFHFIHELHQFNFIHDLHRQPKCDAVRRAAHFKF